MAEIIKKPRKAKARNKDVVFGCIEERLAILRGGPFPTREAHTPELADAVLFCGQMATRFEELLDELRRALNGKDDEE